MTAINIKDIQDIAMYSCNLVKTVDERTAGGVSLPFSYNTANQIGINRSSPLANLHVGGGSITKQVRGWITVLNSAKNYWITEVPLLFENYNGRDITNICAQFDGSIYINDSVVSASDIRFKKNVRTIDDALHKIMLIEPRKYNYIDPLKGTTDVYGFVAQQVKEVLPEAVSLQKDVIPNVFSVAECASNVITLPSSHTLSKNAKIDIIAENGDREIYTIVDVPSLNQVVIDGNIASSNVFVYGEEVEDFHTIEKSYIYTLNVRATQVLSEKIDKLTKDLSTALRRIESLENRLDAQS